MHEMGEDCECEVLPTILQTIQHAPDTFFYAWGVCAFLCLVTVIVSAVHVRSLKRQPATRRRDLYVSVVLVAPVFTATGFLSLMFTRCTPFLMSVQAVYKAIVLYDLSQLVINYTAGENEHDPREARRKLLAAVGTLPAGNYLRVLPFGWMFLCARPFVPNKRLVRLINLCWRQFLYLSPSLAMLQLCLDLQRQGASEVVDWGDRALLLGSILTMMIAVWGLRILDAVTKRLLSPFRTTLKIRTVQVILIVYNVYHAAVAYAFRFLHVEDHYFPQRFLTNFWVSVGVCAQGFVFVFLLVHVFPVEELHTQFLERSFTARSPLMHTQ